MFLSGFLTVLASVTQTMVFWVYSNRHEFRVWPDVFLKLHLLHDEEGPDPANPYYLY